MVSELNGQSLQALVQPLLGLCREAGVRICAHYGADDTGELAAKADESPLTRADLESHELLLAGLTAIDPDIPILSEESSPGDRAGHRNWSRYWLVDPLDGTREFLARSGEFTINIALIDTHRPVLGIVYLPLQACAYLGIPGVSAHSYTDVGNGNWSTATLGTRALQAGVPLLVLASRRHRSKRLETCLGWLEQQWGPLARANSGSALKFCQLAAGKGDFYPRFSPCCEWDTAAGQAVVEAAGGQVLGMDGRPLRYNCSDSLLSPHFYAIAEPGHPLWQRLLQAPHGA